MKWELAIAPASANIRDIIAAIDRGGVQIAFICDEDRRLRGVVTDGDVRRALIRGVQLDAAIDDIVNRHPTVVSISDHRSKAVALMQQFGIYQVPVIDETGRLVGVQTLHSHSGERAGNTRAIVMAGGLGSRLAPLTNTIPKPLIRVGENPILETIVRQLATHGIKQITMCVNHMADMIRDHFGDGSKWGVEIEYTEEKERRGTAGALTLLPQRPDAPFLVLNADLLTSVDFTSLIEFHRQHKQPATMCVREYSMQVPYGVTQIDGHSLKALEEKPEFKFFINAGIYVLDPDVLDRVPDGKMYNMTNIFEDLLAEGRKPSVFPIVEYWLDIGRLDDLERARAEFETYFAGQKPV
ncbi:MAG TPA: nucleotidyltransferase family protein [Hyphomicrobiaceae bacterium]|nr:nucleotidyltransferase family protein [Hyphomicrobiaceae bacterium]